MILLLNFVQRSFLKIEILNENDSSLPLASESTYSGFLLQLSFRLIQGFVVFIENIFEGLDLVS